MSRAYRIEVRESLQRVIRAGDRVSTQLELLEILPKDDMAALLAEELLRRGFERQGENQPLVRREGEIVVTVDPATGEVTVSTESSEAVDLEGSRSGLIYDDAGPGREEARAKLREQLQAELDQQTKQEQERLQREATDALERELEDVRQQLDGAVNRVTAEALKRKAAQLGHIKRVSEDEDGSVEIVLDV